MNINFILVKSRLNIKWIVTRIVEHLNVEKLAAKISK